MRRFCILFPALALGLALGGCAALPYAHEIEKTVLMGALGVDVGAQGLDGVAVTAASGARAGAGDSPGEEPLVLSAQADTVSAACARMQTYGDEYVFLGDVEQVLVGEGEAQRGLETLLSHMARDPELRLEAQLWVVKGSSAADALFDAAQGGGAPNRLESLIRDSEVLAAPKPRTAGRALVDLLDNGCTLLPALERRQAEPGQGAGGDFTLSSAGYAVFRDSALCGYTTEAGTFGADLLAGRGEGRLLELEEPGLTRTAVKLTGVRTRLEPVFSGDSLSGLKVTCALEAQAAEVRDGDGGLGSGDRAWLEGELSRRAEDGIRDVLVQLQALEADCLHLGGRAAVAAPRRKDALKAQWEEAFPGLEIALEVRAEIARGT